MNQTCFICNCRTAVSIRNSTNLFSANNTVPSGKQLHDVVSEIIEKPLKQDGCHSSIVCKKCHKSLTEYDEIQTRLKQLKSELIGEFKNTLTKNNLNYDTYNSDASAKRVGKIVNSAQKTSSITPTKIVLPASKLQPLPPNYMINVGKLAALSKQNVIIPSKVKPITTSASKLNLKKTLSSSVLTQSISTTKPVPKYSLILPANQKQNAKTDLEKDLSNNDGLQSKESMSLPTLILDASTVQNSVASILTTNTTNSMLSFNMKSLPKDFLSSATLTKTSSENGGEDDENCGAKLKEELEEVNEDLENIDEQPMEIDEDCSYTIQTSNKKTVEVTEKNTSTDSKSTSSYLDVDLLQSLDADAEDGDSAGEQSDDGKYIVNVVETLDNEDEEDDDEEEQTIVMESVDGSILRMVSGQEYVMCGGEISLARETREGDAQDHDSNDESQIELQVSGDEETANAIIAAARERGGAFIRVQSGEVFRVRSVRDCEDDTQQVVVKEGDDFKCLLCDKNNDKDSTDKSTKEFTGNAETITSHLKSEHNTWIYICTYCDNVSLKASDHVAHLAEHKKKNQTSTKKQELVISTNGKGNKNECTICKTKFRSRVDFLQHMNTHSDEKPYTCHICNKSFASKYTRQSHLKIHVDRPRPFKCSQCGKSFLTQQNLSQHKRTHNATKDFICKICGKAFGTQHNLEVHGVVHSGQKPFVCGACGKAFARRAEVKDHMRTHTGERPFSCDICGSSFSQRSNLLSHKRATHMDDRRYNCTQCPKRFKRRRLLDYHVKACHTGERPLRCEVCHRTFVYPEHYKKHARIHSGEKPYVCEVCGKSFNSRDNRNTHRFVHSDKKPYECVVCGAGFMRKQLLYAHMNMSGHFAESIVVNQPKVTKITEDEINQAVIVDAVSLKTGEYSNAIFETEDLELDENDKTDSNPTINIVQTNEDSTLLALHSIDGSVKSDGSLLEEVSSEQFIGSAEAAGVMRIVQIQLPDGNNGWMALAPS